MKKVINNTQNDSSRNEEIERGDGAVIHFPQKKDTVFAENSVLPTPKILRNELKPSSEKVVDQPEIKKTLKHTLLT